MTMYARLSEQGLVLEVCEHDPATCFHPDIAKEFTSIPAGAEPGDSILEGEVVKAVLPDPLPLPQPIEQRFVTRNELMNALTRGERIAITESASQDAELQDFLNQLEANGHFDLGDADDIALLDRLELQGVLSEATVTAVKALK